MPKATFVLGVWPLFFQNFEEKNIKNPRESNGLYLCNMFCLVAAGIVVPNAPRYPVGVC